MTDNLTLHDTATGRWWLPDRPTDNVSAELRAGRVFDPPIVEEAYRHIRPNTQVIDLGANFGQMSVLFGRAAADVLVHAVEAEPFVAQTLRRNVIENGASVKVYQCAAWHTSGLDLVFPEPDFVEFGAWGNYGVDPRLVGGRTVRSLAVDDLALDGRPVSFVKIDVQGADLFAMQGARQTIRRNRMPILFEFEPVFQDKFGTSWSDYERFVDEIDYSIARVVLGFNFLIIPRS